MTRSLLLVPLLFALSAVSVLAAPRGPTDGPRSSTPPVTRCAARGPLPDPVCTPGGVLTTDAATVCVPGYAARVRHVSQAMRAKVFRAYGIGSHRIADWEVDHLVPLELGGSNALSNLWPEAAAPWPGYRQKDALETDLHRLVCSGQVKLVDAQKAIAGDWVKTYHALYGDGTGGHDRAGIVRCDRVSGQSGHVPAPADAQAHRAELSRGGRASNRQRRRGRRQGDRLVDG